mmetsp:Transcript_15445/g.38832  ORF Transcript_15445/g.38832 Transcript_15445/m.38832 type:complete len:251 (+) Transcript_15445:407-1159(+)
MQARLLLLRKVQDGPRQGPRPRLHRRAQEAARHERQKVWAHQLRNRCRHHQACRRLRRPGPRGGRRGGLRRGPEHPARQQGGGGVEAGVHAAEARQHEAPVGAREGSPDRRRGSVEHLCQGARGRAARRHCWLLGGGGGGVGSAHSVPRGARAARKGVRDAEGTVWRDAREGGGGAQQHCPHFDEQGQEERCPQDVREGRRDPAQDDGRSPGGHLALEPGEALCRDGSPRKGGHHAPGGPEHRQEDVRGP